MRAARGPARQPVRHAIHPAGTWTRFASLNAELPAASGHPGLVCGAFSRAA
jgi:hypothetical protein